MTRNIIKENTNLKKNRILGETLLENGPKDLFLSVEGKVSVVFNTW